MNNESLKDSQYKLTSINKRFQDNVVLKSISLQINSGDKLLLLGANGSGKSTLLRICAGLSRADHGQVTLLNANEFGYCGHELLLYNELTVYENLKLYSNLLGITPDINEELSRWELTKHTNKKIRELSRGLQFRASLCRALLHKPKNLLLDEPTSAIDDNALSNVLVNISEACERGGFAVIATHDLSRLQAWCNRVMYLNNGSIIADTLSLISTGMEIERAKLTIFNLYREGNR